MRAFRFFTLMALLVCASLPVLAAEKFSAAEEKAIKQLVQQAIKDNPEWIMDSLNAYRSKQEAKQAAEQRENIKKFADQLYNDAGTPVEGNADGDVTIVEFFDYSCGFCKKLRPEMNKLLEKDGKIRLVMKELPILGPGSVLAARAALAAWQMDKSKYWVMHNAFMEHRGQIDEAVVERIAGDAGLDFAELKKTMALDTITQKLEANSELAQKVGISGTPALIIAGELQPGALPLEDLEKAVAAARKK